MEAMTTMPGKAPLPPALIGRGSQAPTPTAAIQTGDLTLSSSAGRLREIEVRLGQSLEGMARGSLMAAQIQKKLEERRNRRREIEEEMLEAYRRYNGEYSGAVRARLQSQPNRSQLWVDLTRMKTDAAHADIMDILRGASGDRPWGLVPEEIPETYPMPPWLLEQGVTLQMLQDNHKRRARAMETEIGSQLDRSDADEAIDRAVLEACITGTGACFGPYTVPDKQPRWEMVLDPNMQARAQYCKQTGYRPAMRHVPIFNYYPIMESNVIGGTDPIEVMPMSRRQFMNLAEQPGVNPAAVLKVLREYPEGNYMPLPEVIELRRIGKDTQPSYSKQYELVLYYGEVTGWELREAGAEVPEELLHLSVTAELWICANYILRARRYEGPNPYHVFNYRKRGALGPFGKGMPMLCRSSQDAINGAARMIMDNAAIASGPIIELNMMLMRLQPGSDPTNITGWKVYLSNHDGHSGKRAIYIHQLPAYTEQFLRIIDQFRRFMDEESGQPSLTHGQTGQGQTRTATGMSILNTNANKMRNHTLRYVDDNLLKPLIEAFYDWNMRYSVKEWLLVPARVIAKGAQTLMSREVETQRLLTALQIFMGHPAFREDHAMRSLFRQMGLPVDDLVRSEQELEFQQQQQQQKQPGAPQGGSDAMIQPSAGTQFAGAPPVGTGSGQLAA